MHGITQEELLELVRDAFKYHAPACIGIAEISYLIEWAKKSTPTEAEILACIDQLLHIGFVTRSGYGWQISHTRG